MGEPLTPEQIAFVRERRVGRLGTVDPNGRPSVVPVCYALIDHQGRPVLVSALDDKPKSVNVDRLQRVKNIRVNPAVTLVVDDYSDDWRRLAFVQIHGNARLAGPDDDGYGAAITALRDKYAQYQQMAIDTKPLIWIDPRSASSWHGAERENLSLSRPGDLPAIIQGRRSVRAFQTKPVPRAAIERAILAAGWAPSPHGRQPWRFAIVESAARRAILADAMAGTWQTQLEMDGQADEIVKRRLDKSRDRLLTAPLLVIACLYLSDLDPYPDPDRQAAETTMAIQSLGAAVQNLLLSIFAEGLDGGWMCAPLFCPDIVRETLGLGPALIPHALIPIGYAAKDPVRRDRLPLDRLIVDWQ
jgi:PPOX class probable F420-dependent enzyme